MFKIDTAIYRFNVRNGRRREKGQREKGRRENKGKRGKKMKTKRRERVGIGKGEERKSGN